MSMSEEVNTDVPFTHAEKLPHLKEKVRQSQEYFKQNVDRFNEFMRFVFDSSLTAADVNKLQSLGKPTIEFNILESIISRLRGEFCMQEPSIAVHAADGVRIENLTPDYLKMIDFLESYMRSVLNDTSTDGLQYNLFTDILAGGFSVAEVFTDYINDLSFDQKIVPKRVFDPTLTGFDPLARDSHKGDGAYCFQLYPRTEDEFVAEFGKEAAKDMKFTRIDGFNWSYKNIQENIVMVCDFYEKKVKKNKIVKLSSGHVVTKRHYKELLGEWNKREFMAQAPIIIEERWTNIESIVRYRFCETKVLAYEETDFRYLPLIFIDGNSVDIKNSETNASGQMTRPYVYQAKGIQRLKNFSGQSVANEIENMIQHKFIVSIEAIPPDYEEAYQNVQQADVLVYNAFYKGDTQTPLAPPQVVQRTQTPPIVESTFMGSDTVTQAILGNYDSTLGTNQKDVSGVAVANGAIHTSAASTPYLMGYIKGLNRIAQIMLDLIPKYIVTPRTLPIMKPDGKRGFQVVNNPQHPQNIDISYNPNELNVKVEAGVNSAIQKQVALDQIIRMMQASPLFAQFINTEGLETILDNMDIRGIDSMKAKAAQFMEMMKKQQAEAANKVPPEIEVQKGLVEVEAMKVQQRKEEAEIKATIDTAKIAVEKQKVDAQVMAILNDIEVKNAKIGIEQERIDSENARTAIETAIELGEKMKERISGEAEE